MALFTAMGEKRINLPEDINSLPVENQHEIVKSVVRKHYDDNQGEWHFFGKIIGYYYFHHFRENIRLDVEGNIEKNKTTPFEEPGGYLVIGNKEISGGMFKFSEKSPNRLELNKSMVVEPRKPGEQKRMDSVLKR
jgi:hypothetical protein